MASIATVIPFPSRATLPTARMGKPPAHLPLPAPAEDPKRPRGEIHHLPAAVRAPAYTAGPWTPSKGGPTEPYEVYERRDGTGKARARAERWGRAWTHRLLLETGGRKRPAVDLASAQADADARLLAARVVLLTEAPAAAGRIGHG